MANRWKRRKRLYAALSALSLVMPSVLLYHVNFDRAGSEAILANYPNRGPAFQALLCVVVIVVWLLISQRVFLGTLEAHRRGDTGLRSEMAQLRANAKRRGPQQVLALGGLAAIVLSAMWFLWRR